jgi:hypothetical protein
MLKNVVGIVNGVLGFTVGTFESAANIVVSLPRKALEAIGFLGDN